MNWFIAHLFLSMLWAALLGSYDTLTVLSGFLLGLGLFKLTLEEPTRNYRKRLYSIGRFSLFYLKEILSSNLKIAGDILRGKPRINPGIVAVKADSLSPRATALVANLITMTPGTLSLDVSQCGDFIYVHCLYVDDAKALRESMERDYVNTIAHLLSSIET